MPKNEIRTRLTADGKGFKLALDTAQSQAKAWSNQIKGAIAGAFTIGALTNFGRQIKDIADNVLTLKSTLGLTSDEIQRMDLALNRTGKATLENFKTGFQNFTASITMANADPKSKQSKLFSFLGLDPMQLREGNQLESFLKTLERINLIKESSAKIETSRTLVGPDSGLRLAAAAAEDLRGQLEKLRNSPAIVSDDQLANIKDASAKIDEMGRVAKVGLFEAFMTPLKTRVQGFRDLLTGSPKIGMNKIAQSQFETGEILGRTILGMFGAKLPKRKGITDITQPPKTKVEQAIEDMILGFPDLTKEETEKKVRSITSDKLKVSSDSLSKIGGFVGQSSRAITIQQQQLEQAKGTNRRLDRGVKLQDGL